MKHAFHILSWLTLFGWLSEAMAHAQTTGTCPRAEADASLLRTPELLSVLADAGVVDAGGAGFVLFLDSMLSVIADRAIPDPAVPADGENRTLAT